LVVVAVDDAVVVPAAVVVPGAVVLAGAVVLVAAGAVVVCVVASGAAVVPGAVAVDVSACANAGTQRATLVRTRPKADERNGDSDNGTLSCRAYGVSCRARAKRAALLRVIAMIRPGPERVRASGSPAPQRSIAGDSAW
jgi:hypothetical protein